MHDPRAFGVASLVSLLLCLGFTAQAGAEGFTAAQYTADLSGKEEEAHVVKVEGGLSLSCEAATLEGMVHEPAGEIAEVEPAFGECTFAGFLATVTNEGCTLTLDAPNSVMDVACATEKALKVSAGTCEFKIGTQTNLSTVEYANAGGSPEAISMTENVTGLKYTITKDGFACPLAGTGEKTGATLTGEYLLEGSYEGTAISLSLKPQGLKVRLCMVPEWPECNSPFPTPKNVKATLVGKATFVFSLSGQRTVTCTESTFAGTTEVAKYDGEDLSVLNTSLTFEGCSTCGEVSLTRPYVRFGTTSKGNGYMDIGAHSSVPDPPTLTLKCTGLGTCVFSAPAVLGTVTGAPKEETGPAQLEYWKPPFKLVSAKSTTGCAGPLEFIALYNFSEPGLGEFWLSRL